MPNVLVHVYFSSVLGEPQVMASRRRHLCFCCSVMWECVPTPRRKPHGCVFRRPKSVFSERKPRPSSGAPCLVWGPTSNVMMHYKLNWGWWQTDSCTIDYRTTPCLKKNCANLFFAPSLSNMNRFQQKLEELFWKKPFTKQCPECPLHLEYVLALRWEIWSVRLSHQHGN